MSIINARGANRDFEVGASYALRRTCQVTTAGVARDLTDASVHVAVKDDCEPGNPDYGDATTATNYETYDMVITNAATGEFVLLIPATAFLNKEGGRLSYELYMIENDDEPTGLMWGYLYVQERG